MWELGCLDFRGPSTESICALGRVWLNSEERTSPVGAVIVHIRAAPDIRSRKLKDCYVLCDWITSLEIRSGSRLLGT